jgi:Zn finger protein HypA/HybF involved in hydrogenase expression
MRNLKRAFVILHRQAQRVICAACDRDVTEASAPRLWRLGCPGCGSKHFDYEGLPETLQNRLEAQRAR